MMPMANDLITMAAEKLAVFSLTLFQKVSASSIRIILAVQTIPG
jgi:hypothetical protein